MCAEKGSTALWHFLSANEYLPVLRATVEERVWLYKIHMEKVLEGVKGESGMGPKVGSQKWLDNVVRKVMTQAQQTAFSPSYLFTHPHGWEMLQELGRFPVLKSGRHVTVRLLDSVMKPGSRTHNQPNATGGVSVRRDLCERRLIGM